MSKRSPTITDLQPRELVSRLGLSRSYASELVNRRKAPSLDVALRIQAEFGVPVSAWLHPEKAA